MFFFHETPSTVSTVTVQSEAARSSMEDGSDEPYPAFPGRCASTPQAGSSIPRSFYLDPVVAFVGTIRRLYRSRLLCCLFCRCCPHPSFVHTQLILFGGCPGIGRRLPSWRAIAGRLSLCQASLAPADLMPERGSPDSQKGPGPSGPIGTMIAQQEPHGARATLSISCWRRPVGSSARSQSPSRSISWHYRDFRRVPGGRA